ncbi:hypothetical protein ACOMHN_047589 [Nucella lapillus]
MLRTLQCWAVAPPGGMENSPKAVHAMMSLPHAMDVHQHLTNISLTSHQHLTNISPTSHQHLTHISPTSHQHLTNISPTSHQHLTNI